MYLRGHPPPKNIFFLDFMQFFLKKLAKSYVGAPPSPPRGESLIMSMKNKQINNSSIFSNISF